MSESTSITWDRQSVCGCLTHVEPDLTVGKVGVDTETWSETEGQVGKKTHSERGDESNAGGSDDIVSPELLLAQVVVEVGNTDGVVGGTVADTWPSSVRQDRRVDTDDLGKRQPA